MEKTESTSDILLAIKDLQVVYEVEEGTVHAVNGISLQLVRGKTLGIVGETGAGKTTTALSILRLLPEKTGRIKNGIIEFNGSDLRRYDWKAMQGIRGNKISMIFQDPMTSLNPVLTVNDQIAEAIELHKSSRRGFLSKCLRKNQPTGKTYSEEVNAQVNQILEMVGIPASRKNEYPHQFSGGMKQRVVIAIALVCQPELVIADEPTTALDVTIQAQVLDMIDTLKQEINTSMLLITHDLGVVAQICDDVAIMYAGEIIENGSVEDIFEGEYHHPYTVGLFDSLPRLDDKSDRLKPIMGLMPDPYFLPKGCKFHPRCPRCMEVCKTELPPINSRDTHYIKCHLDH